MKYETEQLLSFLQSGDLINVELALQLAESQQIALNTAAYEALYDMCNANIGKALIEKIAWLFAQNSLNLDLRLRYIGKLPDGIEDLINLKALSMSQNKIETATPAFGQLKALQQLNLEENLLTELPDSFGDLENLIQLNLNHNRLYQLPETMGRLQQLKTLGLRNNELTTLPMSLAKLQYLEEIDLSGNPLREIPEVIFACKQLRRLDLSDTGLESLPDNFGQLLPELRRLDLSNNPIADLPASFAELKKLRKCYLIETNIAIEKEAEIRKYLPKTKVRFHDDK